MVKYVLIPSKVPAPKSVFLYPLNKRYDQL